MRMGALIETIADYAVGEQTSRLPDEVRHHAKRALIDWFASLLPGARIEPATRLFRALADELGHGSALVYGVNQRAPLRTAALLNGAASHTVEFDDIFRDALYHPGCPVIAAALAAAQARGVDGDTLLRAIVVGYEVSTRIGVAVQPSHYRFWHTTGTIGTFGAAAAVATILKLNRTQFADTIGTAGTLAAALQQAFRVETQSKPLHAGHAAEAGALAALSGAEGVTGAHDILEGPAGFGAAMSVDPDWSKATEGLGSRYNITAMTFKNHGCCGHSFAPIDAALVLKKEYAITPADIERITVGTYKASVDITGRKEVASPFEGRFSTPYTVASAMVHGSVRLDSVTPERLSDPAVHALMQRVKMEIDPRCEADFPSRRSALVSMLLKDGRTVQHYQPTRKGDPDMPLSDLELTEKYYELTTPVVGKEPADRLLAEIWGTDRANQVGFAV
jgi:2-methylcitrate dehydratase PrpD